MTYNKEQKIRELIKKIPTLTEGQIFWLNRVIRVFESPYRYENFGSDLFDKLTIENFGDALRIHHSFSAEPFSKDKFEYVLEKVLNMSGHRASLAPKGQSGHDITIDGIRVSLKTQADSNIREDRIWISKFMELGKGSWGDNPHDLVNLREFFLQHIKKYDRIFTLRAIKHAPEWHYELIEIPMSLMLAAEGGILEMKLDSKQLPKPGYCHVRTEKGQDVYQLYFDGGSERKLQIKNILKSSCAIHANWKFLIPPE